MYVGSSSASAALTIKANQLTSGTTTCNSFFSGTGAGVTVPAGAVCTLLPGTKVTGNVQVSQGGTFVDQGATISGNLQATNAVAITVVGGTVNGNLQATGVGAISVSGGGTIGGNLQVTGETFAPAGGHNALCNTKVNGNVQVTGSSASSPFDIGNTGACAGGAALTVGGNLQVTSNAGALLIAGNTVNGNIQVQSNTGGGSLTKNSAGGSCQLGSNNPKIVGTTNTARGSNSCNATA